MENSIRADSERTLTATGSIAPYHMQIFPFTCSHNSQPQQLQDMNAADTPHAL